MRALSTWAVLLLILPWLLSGCGAGEPTSAPGTGDPPDPHAVNRALGQGVNLGNALEAPSEASGARGFSWGYWEFGAGFGVYDRQAGQWRRGLLEALLPDSPELQ